ncbi:crossover junction endodeoxyribonuclease RuvC [Pyxidicoccus fallax]|uniref:Crossover junction endodeoxyribonuclease RuvC n=1 Tax=Pyxidicoccus fallax TaxID=394095 RepID=A0A848LUE7_9BACT|nr:crossover junction endodeoxyribonuclease RuvC [Pyxidicoccus fallax]NMO21299.1 crossover junction endodeoxyribonuclease RuvC [Pyxidicoccus fallax]NPC84408.1 crossover junction endodeoxyribonuclease RuvC [Pyxidicoccus fallax]
MRVLGVDPGSRFMGFGVVEEKRGRLVHVGHGVIKVDESAPLAARLKDLHASLEAALARYRPDAVAVEGLFTFRNARSALVLGHARGVALLAAAQAGLEVFEYAPAKVKKSVGAGGADGKDAVARMVRTFLSLEASQLERADASDALAVALCHLNHGRAASPASGTSGRKKGAASLLADRLTPAYRRPEAR